MKQVKIEILTAGKWEEIYGHCCEDEKSAQRWCAMGPSITRYTIDGVTVGPTAPPPAPAPVEPLPKVTNRTAVLDVVNFFKSLK